MSVNTEEPDTLLLEQYKSLQAETHLRIGEYHKLLFFKMASCGALFSYVLAKESPSILGVLLAPFISVMVDFLIVNNICLIAAIGEYVRVEIESRYLPYGWETVCRKTSLFGKKDITWLNDWLVVAGSTFVIFLLSTMILVHYGQFQRRSTWWILIISVLLLVLDVWYSLRILITGMDTERYPLEIDH